MTLIYAPRGRDAEYSPLALNIYHGCDHRCSYKDVSASGKIKHDADQA